MSQSWQTPRMTSRFPWKVGTQRNPCGRGQVPTSRRLSGLAPGAAGAGAGSKAEGSRESGVGGGTGEWAPRGRPHPLLLVTTAPSKVQSSSPVPLPMRVKSGVMVGQSSGKSPDQEKSVSKADRGLPNFRQK